MKIKEERCLGGKLQQRKSKVEENYMDGKLQRKKNTEEESYMGGNYNRNTLQWRKLQRSNC